MALVTISHAGVVLVALLIAAALLGLRFLRRGLTRFHLAAAFAALALLPTALASLVAAWGMREALGAAALTGSGGVAAISAGCAETLTSLGLGLGSTLALALLAIVVLGAGTSRVPQAEGRPRKGLPLTLASLLVIALAFALVAAELIVAVVLLKNPPSVASQVTVLLSVSPLVGLGLIVVAVWGLVQAPRHRPTTGAILSALALPVVVSVASGLLLAGVFYVSHCLYQVALTGDPCACRLVSAAPCRSPESTDRSEPSTEPAVAPTPPVLLTPEPEPAGSPGVSSEGPEGDIPGGVPGGVEGGVSRGVESGAAKPIRVGTPIKQPRVIRKVQPLYPPLAREARIQGVVILEATIDPQGHVSSVRVLRGVPLLDQAAIDAVRQWVYAPTLLNGVPVPVIMTVTVNFRL
jgi:TonB family protein